MFLLAALMLIHLDHFGFREVSLAFFPFLVLLEFLDNFLDDA